MAAKTPTIMVCSTSMQGEVVLLAPPRPRGRRSTRPGCRSGPARPRARSAPARCRRRRARSSRRTAGSTRAPRRTGTAARSCGGTAVAMAMTRTSEASEKTSAISRARAASPRGSARTSTAPTRGTAPMTVSQGKLHRITARAPRTTTTPASMVRAYERTNPVCSRRNRAEKPPTRAARPPTAPSTPLPSTKTSERVRYSPGRMNSASLTASWYRSCRAARVTIVPAGATSGHGLARCSATRPARRPGRSAPGSGRSAPGRRSPGWPPGRRRRPAPASG